MISGVGQFGGAFLCSAIADRIGRKGALATGVLISCGGVLGEIFSSSRVALLVSKMILGVGLGTYLTIGPLYCSEVRTQSGVAGVAHQRMLTGYLGLPRRPPWHHHRRHQSRHRPRTVTLKCRDQGLWLSR
jgi:MFS family permease